MPVGRPAGRPTHATVDRPDRPPPTESRAISVGRPGPVDRSFLCTARARRSTGRSTGLLHRSTESTSGLLHAPFLAPLSSDLCTTFFHLLYLLYLLFPTILHLGEDFSNLSRSPTYPRLSSGEIDTRSRLGIYSSAINWDAPHMPFLHFTLGELPYMPITECVSNSATT